MTSETTQRPVVVVGLDGSAESIAALRWARRYAEATGAQVRAVLAWHYPSAVGPAPTGVAPAAVTDEVRERLEHTLTQAVSEVYPGGQEAGVAARISYGHPAEVLIGESEEADLLVVGSRGRGAFTGMFAGSVSVTCVNHARCPVAVIR